mmetsp:Transcript_22483/g.32615  ORF Transcript_22483/g.32615 Transcript_22483/m.32615 type:complete len:123 (-) Transcript_22483:273-641(-)|eukprot:CAMPEP_0113934274 /NCGR_PEP_ID=MMETSP1339-20121228/1618_1 /TAXON_ID=94617 /ORGANISM="Fibrocapsa japonica" /LENGTH=122 /DNA_ID=CAMNT_0000936001 /DNA_START=92 /DNA_END=460 /DNA_ORIENTATION=+ /assembly_acc=CAM_ASM_000762
MKFVTFLAAVVVALVALLGQANAFVPASTLNGLTTRSQTLESSTTMMACRFKSKKSKRLRNQENMRKFRKKGTTSRKKLVRQRQSEQEQERESAFVAKLFVKMPQEAEKAKAEQNNKEEESA